MLLVLDHTMSRKMSDKKASAHDKRERLVHLGRFAHCTMAAKTQLAKQFKDHGIPDAISKCSQLRARREYCMVETPHGPVVQSVGLPLTTGATTTWIQHPLAMLYHAAREGGAFLSFLRSQYEKHPPSSESPWRFLFYSDGVGMKVLDHDARKVEACYWSLAEFDRPSLNCEHGWFCIAAPRVDLLVDLPGGMSHFMAILLRVLFSRMDHAGHGFFLPIGEDGAPVMFFVQLHVIVADEIALKQLFHFRGASARLPCSLCINATALKGNVPRTPFFRPITCINFGEFMPNTKDGVRDCLTHLNVCHAHMGVTAFTEEQRKLGWTYAPFNVLLDDTLDVDMCTSMMLDWFHLYLVNGLFTFEFGLFMRLWAADGIGFPQLCTFLAAWTWPRPNMKPWKTFENPMTDEGNLKCSASEILSLYPVIAMFVKQILQPLGRYTDQVNSFLALCDVLDLLTSLNHGINVSADVLELTIIDHFQKYKAAYKDLLWVWKHHGCLHLADMLRRFKFLLALFTHERRHRLIKKFLHGRMTLQSFERGVIEELTCDHLYYLKIGWLAVGLVNGSCSRAKQNAQVREWYPHAISINVSSDAHLAEVGTLHAGDVAFVRVDGRDEVCEIWFHFQVDQDEPHSLVSIWHSGGDSDDHCARCVVASESPVDVRTCQLRGATTYQRFANGDVIALVPPLLR